MLGNIVYGQTTGIIVLEKQTPSTAVVATATQLVDLKPGFHAVGTVSSSFNAKIGTYNSLSPMIQVASGSMNFPASPSTSRNYILTKTYLLPSVDSPTLNAVQYFDGLGRPTQTIAVGITQSGADLVSRVGYDNAGRENIKYLPVPIGGNFGLFADDASLSSGAGTVYGSDSRPYIETLLEASPLNRPTGQKKPGDDWSGHAATISYETNGSDVLYFTVSSTNTLQKGINYTANTLYKTVNTDEDVKSVTEYKDKLGHVVMKQSSTDVQTYYVYNDLNQLSYVLPPGFVDGIGASTYFDDTNVLLKQFGYVYRYDERGNCIYKRLPGCTPVYMVYDKADRMVLSQDGNQRKRLLGASIQWTVTKYDVLGRAVFTGLMYRSEVDSLLNYKSIRDVLSNDVVTDSYAGFASATPLTISYYDNYNFLSSSPSTLAYQVLSGYDNAYPVTATSASGLNATGLLTGTRTYFLDGSGSNTTAMYYDDRGRVVQTRATNHLGGFDLAYNQYDFIGKVVKTYKTHGISGASDTYKELYTYTYDNGQRPLTTTYSLNGGTTVTLASNSYDELERLKTKNRHNSKEQGLYEYNIQNWPTHIKNGDFEEFLYYNNNPGGLANFTPCYNGNIAASTWIYKSANQGYCYSYDDLNRLVASLFRQGTSTNANGSFDENYSFDKMGNVLTLQRKSNNKLVDDLTLHYTNGEKSNQIDWITDAQGTQALNNIKEYQDISKATSGEFAYDVNGNMIKDLDRDIYTIKYNVLNLPDIIQFKNGNQIKNLYDAGGHKLGTEYFTWRPGANAPVVNAGDLLNITYSQASTDQSGTVYIGNIEYNTLNGNSALTTLSRIYNDEGYVENPANPQYYYFRHDHLGDNREVWLANTNTTVQRTQYYLSGLPWAYQTDDNPGLQHRKYNGKEFVEMHGYDTYDIVWRQYYPAIMRFQTPDPEAEEYYSISPYAMCDDNTVRNIDPDGRDGWDFMRGISEAFLDDANPNPIAKPLSNSSNPNNQTHYSIGQTIGHVVAAVTGALETIEGGGTTLGGATIAVAGSEFVAPIPVGGAIALAGATEATHGVMMMSKANGNLANQRGRTNTTVTTSTRKEAKEARPKLPLAKSGEKQVTNQTRNKSGEGNKMKTDGNSQTQHFHDKNHNKPNKPNVHYRTTKKIKPNE